MSKYENLFKEFEPVSAKEWKQRIQMELKGADYGKTLIWESLEGIHVKPFYHADDFEYLMIPMPKENFKIVQHIFIDKPEIANKIALDALSKGVDAIQFTATQSFDLDVLFQDFKTLKNTPICFFKNEFFSENFNTDLLNYFNDDTIIIQQDSIGQLIKTGNWFSDEKTDFDSLKKLINRNPKKTSISINATIYQNAGATIVQQIAYALAHASEYLNTIGKEVAQNITFEFAVGSNYFFEIAKLRAFRYLWQQLTEEHGFEYKATIITTPTNRNKTIYDYHVNMLRTSTEYMSAVLGGTDYIITKSYDSIFKKSNNFSKRIARNQLLLLLNENQFDQAQNYAQGSYYIEALTIKIAKKALEIFKSIEKSGGFIEQLKRGVIQDKIQEAASKEQELFDTGKLTLVGTNKYPNEKDIMKDDIELYPFPKYNKIKTLIKPIISKRLSVEMEQERLKTEK